MSDKPQDNTRFSQSFSSKPHIVCSRFLLKSGVNLVKSRGSVENSADDVLLDLRVVSVAELPDTGNLDEYVPSMAKLVWERLN